MATPWASCSTGPGPSGSYGPHVRAFERDATAIGKVSFYAYGTLRYGVKPRAADLDGDGIAEILTTPGQGPVFGPHVRAFNFDGGPLAAMGKVSFFAFGTLKYGANGTGGQVDADGYDEILAAPGPGTMFQAQVRGFDYDNASLRSIGKINAYVYTSSPYGATVASADVESDGLGSYRDGFDEIVAGRGPGVALAADIRLFDYDGASLAQKLAIPAPAYTWMYGIELAGGDADAGDADEVVSAPGPDPTAPARVLVWEYSPAISLDPQSLTAIPTDDFTAFASAYGGHVAVGKAGVSADRAVQETVAPEITPEMPAASGTRLSREELAWGRQMYNIPGD